MQHNCINMIGKKFGRLKVIDRALKPSHLKTTAAFWNCLCDCGINVVAQGDQLRRGNKKSCGCLQRDHWESRRLPPGESAFNACLAGYIKGAKSRGHSFKLTRDESYKFMKGKCHYCGGSPNNVFKVGNRKKDKRNGDFIYNGIDRVDNTQGYTSENVVSCCGICNKMKNNMTVNVFISHVKKIVLNFA